MIPLAILTALLLYLLVKVIRAKPGRIEKRRELCLIGFALAVCVGGLTHLLVLVNEPYIIYSAYNSVRDDIQNAVAQYASVHYGVYPTISGTVTINGSVYNIIDICPLLTSEGGLLRQVPDGVISINDSNNDNCDSGCLGCDASFSYIWAVDDEGNVYSTCVGEECTASGEDGYQDVWP